jgi:hypothetical protein
MGIFLAMVAVGVVVESADIYRLAVRLEISRGRGPLPTADDSKIAPYGSSRAGALLECFTSC